MKPILISALAVGSVLMADGNSDAAQARAKVQIVAPVKVKRLSHIDFGSIVVDDYNRPAKVHMRFKGGLSNWTPTPATELSFESCARYRSSAPHTPGAFQVERDALVAPSFFGYMAGVKLTCDQSVVLAGGHGAPVLMVVDTARPPRDFVPASPVGGVLYSRFQVAGSIFIPARSLGYKEGQFNVSVAYM